jgi:hypothetical protein
LSEHPSIEVVRAAVEKEVAADTRQARRVALYLCHRLTGLRLKEIGEAFGVGESAVTQASRRVRGQLQRNLGLAEMVKRLEAGLNVSEVQMTPSPFISGIYTKHRGKCICSAGEQFFVGDTAKEAVARATAAHPNDEGWFMRYIPREKVGAERSPSSGIGCA